MAAITQSWMQDLLARKEAQYQEGIIALRGQINTEISDAVTQRASE